MHAETVSFLRAQLPLSAVAGHAFCTDATTQIAVRGGEGGVRGTIIWGAKSNVFSAWSPWLLASDLDEAVALVRSGPCSLPDVQFDMSLAPTFGSVPIARELLLTRHPRAASMRDSNVRRLSELDLDRIALPPDVSRQIGDVRDFAHEAPFWCLVDDNTVLAIADTIASFADHVVIQQVYTAAHARRAGLAHRLVGDVVSRYGASTLVWITAEENVASRRLAERHEFQFATNLGVASQIK